MRLWSGQPYWLKKDGCVNSYDALRKDISCDVVVVGSGITGALLAYQFSSQGYDTVLVDKRNVANGSTAVTTAMLQYEIDIPLYRLIERVGAEAAVDSYHAGVSAINTLEGIEKGIGSDCDFKRKKSLFLAASAEDCDWLRREFHCRKKYKLDVSWITRNELMRRYGVSGHGAILSGIAADLDAYRLAHQLIAYSNRHHRLKVFERTQVESISYKRDMNMISLNTGKLLSCKNILYATGYESCNMITEKNVELRSTFVLISKPLQQIRDSLKKLILWNSENPYLFMRTTQDNRVLVGGGDEKFPNEFSRENALESKKAFLLRKIHAVFPNLNIIPDLAWTGTFGVTRDALPYIGPHPDYPNSFFLLGFGGNGITFSITGMKILSDAIAGRPNKFLNYYRFGR